MRTLIVIAIFFLTALSGCTTDPRAPQRPPNILFLLSDDQRFDTLGCMGNSIIQTPHIDALAKRGVVFDSAFVTTSICMTSRASILRGQYAARHGINDFTTMFTPEELSQTYVGRLKSAGYRVGFIGKWGVGKPPKDYFDYDRAFPGQGFYRVKQADGTVKHLTNIMGDQAIEFLDGAKDAGKPWSLSISFKAAHTQDEDTKNPYHFDPDLASLYKDATIPVPVAADAKYYDAQPAFLKKTESRVRWGQRFTSPEYYQQSVKAYYRLITGMDANIGRVVDKLRELKMDDNTIIIFTSDNGYYLGEYGFADKWYAHEPSLRVPLVVVDPREKGTAVTRSDEVVLNIDLAPTMLEMAGLKADEKMQGRSLIPVLRGETPKDWRTEFFYEHHFKHKGIPRSEAVRTEKWKYIRWIDSEPLHEELYDLKSDPRELNNLASDAGEAAQMKVMREKWETMRAEAR